MEGVFRRNRALRDHGLEMRCPAAGPLSRIVVPILLVASLALGAAGSIVVVGAPYEDGDGAGIDPIDTDTQMDSGAVYRFVADGVGIPESPPDWGPPQRFKAVNSGAEDLYGSSVAVSSSGEVFAVGAPGEDGTLPDLEADGAVYVYTIAGSVVTDVAYLQATHRYDSATFGWSVALNGDGTVLAVGSPQESISEVGVDGEQIDPASNAGAVDVLIRAAGAAWSSQGAAAPKTHYIKASNTGEDDFFGSAVSLSSDGDTLVVGAPGEAGNGKKLDPNNNPADNSVPNAGAVYAY